MRLRAFCRHTLLLGLLLLITAPGALRAQSPADTALVSLLRGTSLEVGALVQADAQVGDDAIRDGFNLRATRLRLRGEAPGLQFFVQTDFNRNPSVLDGRLRVPLSPNASVAAGLYKTPFSAEFVRFRGALRTLERSRVVNALAPQRQIGVTIRADIPESPLQFEGGLFNGPQGLQTNDNNSLLYVGRLTSTVPVREGALDVGVQAAFSNDRNVTIPSVTNSFRGQRTLFGLDAEFQNEDWLLAVTWITASLDPPNRSSYQPWGYYATVGYRVAPRHQLLLRLDGFSDGRPATTEDERLIAGYTLFWTTALKFQVNYSAPLDEIDTGALGARLQLALN